MPPSSEAGLKLPNKLRHVPEVDATTSRRKIDVSGPWSTAGGKARPAGTSGGWKWPDSAANIAVLAEVGGSSTSPLKTKYQRMVREQCWLPRGLDKFWTNTRPS
jgi:hypothetical protein